MAQINQSETGERDFLIFSEFSNLVLEEGMETDLEVKIINKDSKPENININLISDPDAKDWDIILRNKIYKGFQVRQVNLLQRNRITLRR